MEEVSAEAYNSSDIMKDNQENWWLRVLFTG